ncbi:hypothetical protein H1R20_g11579, partial [Candolleomyces eurysporus]
MAPKSWATDDQGDLLTGYIPLYKTYQATTKRYQPFWDIVFPQFLQRWPILPDGTTVESLNEEEFNEYVKRLDKLHSRIKEWYRWRCNSRSRNTTTTVTMKDMKDVYFAGTRTAKEYEVLVKLNPDVFKPEYQAECTHQGATGRKKLPIWHQVAKELWEKATPEQKEAVQAELARAREEADEPDPATPGDYQKFWDKLPAILSKTFGDKPETPLFSNTWADHDKVLVDQLASFASRYEFSAEICAKRSLLHVQKTEASDLTEKAAVVSESEGGGSAGLSDSGDSATNSDDSVVDSTDQPEPKASSASTPISCQPQAAELAPRVNANATDDSAVTVGGSFDLSTYNPADFTIPDDFNTDELDWADPRILEAISRMNAPDADWDPTILSAASTTSGAGQVEPKHGSAPMLSTSGKSVIAPPLPNAPVPTPTAFAANTRTAPPFTASRTSCTSVHLNPRICPSAHSSLSALAFDHPSEHPVYLPCGEDCSTISHAAPPTFQLQTDPDFQAPAIATISTTTPATASPGAVPDPTALSAYTVPVTNENVPPAPAPAGNAPQHAPAKDSGDGDPSVSPLCDVGDGIHRSNRAPVPSTRLEKLNEIGTNIAPPKPPTNTTPDTKEPAWFAPAYQHLQRANLGPAWIDLVEKWAKYERLRYWKSGKGLPAKGRPEEWSQWVTKARQGACNYQNIPNIDDPTEFGIAVGKWVHSFHPPDFTRTGLHGMVSALTLMVWWGTAALTPSSWNEDSWPQWQALVQDLVVRYDTLLGVSASKRPREDGHSDETNESEHPRMELGAL